MTDANSFMEYLVTHRATNLPAEALAEVFDSLIWCFSDNGHGICAVRHDWLQSTDEYKVEIALSMEEVSPFSTKVEMVEQLQRIAQQFPSLRKKRTKWLEQADALP